MYRQTTTEFTEVGGKAFSMTNIAETFTKEDTAMAPTLSILIDNLGTNIPYQYGLSYLNLVSKPIPRSLWHGKPIEFDTQMMRILFPKYAAVGVGFAFSAISEPLVNFGVAGVIFFFFLLGILNAKLLRKLSQTPSPLFLFLNAWTAGFMFVLIRGNLSVDFQRAVFPLFSGLIVLFLYDNRMRVR
jgi:oligosaccharide repeat unit polymerase